MSPNQINQMSPNQINQENYSCILLLFTFHTSVCVFSELLGQVCAVLMSWRMGTLVETSLVETTFKWKMR